LKGCLPSVALAKEGKVERLKGLDVIYEDEAVVVVDKPAGVYVHPSPGHETGTLVEALLSRYPEMAKVGGRGREGVVHRLDAGTSGVMIFARTQPAYRKLRADFESHARIEKTYLAVLHGAPKAKTGRLETTIGRKPWDAKRMAANVPDGVRAVTNWTVLAKKGGLSLVEFVIETGRMHQIRVHAAHLGCPLVGDDLYGDPARDARLRVCPRRPLLHAVTLAFDHPVTGRRMEFSAEPPSDLVHVI